MSLMIGNDMTENDVGMTPMRIAILDFVRDHIAAHGYPPSVREIGDAVGLASTSSVHRQLRLLEKLGMLVRAGRRCRALRLGESCAAEAAGEAA